MSKKRRLDGEGSIFEESPGRWRVSVIINGTRVRRRAKTRQEALEKLRELHKLREARIDIASAQLTVQQWLDHWMAGCKTRLKEKTLEGYAGIIAQYITPYVGTIRLDRLSAHDIEQWMHTLARRGLSAATIANARRRLHTALNVAVRRRVVFENVVSDVDAPRLRTKRVKALNERQVVQFLQAIAGHRLYALYVLAITLGLRRGELLGLRWASIDLDDRPHLFVSEQLQVIGGKAQFVTPKSEASEREIPLSTEIVTVLREHRRRIEQERTDRWPDTDLVFPSAAGTPLSPRNVLRHLKKTLKRLGLPIVSFHSLRHSAGSIMLSHGANLADVSNILGHSSVIVTARIYVHAFDEGKRRAIELGSTMLQTPPKDPQ